MTTAYHEIQDRLLGGWLSEDNRIDEHLKYIDGFDFDNEAWQFNEIRAYVRKSDGVVLYATDSGCSCPSPFEDTYVKDLIETTPSGFVTACMERGGYRPASEIAQEASAVARQCEAYIATLGLVGK